MNRTSLKLFPFFFLLTGCISQGMPPKSEKYHTEMTLHKTRADIEEIKHDLHTQKMEQSILEGKLLNQDDTLASMKKETLQAHQSKLDKHYEHILALEKRLAQIEKTQSEISSHLRELVQSSSEMNKALAQNKDRMNEIEKNLSTQSKSLSEFAKVKRSLSRSRESKES